MLPRRKTIPWRASRAGFWLMAEQMAEYAPTEGRRSFKATRCFHHNLTFRRAGAYRTSVDLLGLGESGRGRNQFDLPRKLRCSSR
jgi:hypothetical protein